MLRSLPFRDQLSRFLPLLIVLTTLAGCASAPSATPTAPTATVPSTEAPSAEAPKLPNDVHWVRDSAEYRADLLQTYALATGRLEELAAGRASGTWAVALDADETVISNSLLEKEVALSGEGFSTEVWNAWVRRQEATALPGARDFLLRVHELGGRIAIVTNRKIPLCPDTESNFRKLDLPFDVMLCRGEDHRKEPRWAKVQDGTAKPGLPPLEILMWLGDNIQDFPAGEQDWRFDSGALKDFGRIYFVMPNPMYGSWTSNPAE